MKRLILSGLITIACGSANSQNTFLPSIIVDSIIWRLNVGANCDSLQAKQSIEINKLTTQLVHQGTSIALRDTKITQLEEIVKALQERSASQETLSQTRQEKLKIRIRKFVRVVIIESGVIVVLAILLI